jgi:hypothetical protein
MSFYTEIEKIVPYMKSIRKLKTYLCFDIEFPTHWKILKKYAPDGKVMEQENNGENRLLSFVSEIGQEEISKIIQNIRHIIDYNKELEEKERLFQNKVNELKQIFDKQGLDKLQSLKFELREFNLGDDDEEQRNTDPVVAE